MDRFAPTTTPRPIPFSPSVTHEWARLRFPNNPLTLDSARSPALGPPQRSGYRAFSPRVGALSRSHTPTSNSSSPSPCPSLSSVSSHNYHHPSMVEIEELPDSDDDVDSGIELLQGEFEEAPENYGEPLSEDDGYEDDDEDEDDDDKCSVIHGLRRLWQQQQQQQHQSSSSDIPMSRKRTFAESLDSSDNGDSESGSNTDSNSGGRIRRRKLAPTRRPEMHIESSRSTPEFMMEL